MRSELNAVGLVLSPDRSLCDQGAVAQLVTPDSEVRCTVFRRPVYPKMQEHPRSRYEGLNFSGKAYVVAFANVDCWDYTEGAKRATVSIKLRGVFRKLGATSPTVGRY